MNQNSEEINLIADFEMEYGDESNWSSDVQAEFDKKWAAIQQKYAK